MALTTVELSAPLTFRNGNSLVKVLAETIASQVKMLDVSNQPSTVQAEIETLRADLAGLLAANAAMTFAGIVDGTHALPSADYKVGQVWHVAAAGTYAGQVCEIGDLIICLKDYEAGTASNADFVVSQTNIDGAVVGPASAVNENVAIFDGTTGKLIKDSAITKASVDDVIANAVHGPATAVDSNLPAFDTTTGKLVKDSGIAVQDVEDTIARVWVMYAGALPETMPENLADGGLIIVDPSLAVESD